MCLVISQGHTASEFQNGIHTPGAGCQRSHAQSGEKPLTSSCRAIFYFLCVCGGDSVLF